MQITLALQQSKYKVIRQIILTPENDEDQELLEEFNRHKDYRMIRLAHGKLVKTEEEKSAYESLFIVMSRSKCPTWDSRDLECRCLEAQ